MAGEASGEGGAVAERRACAGSAGATSAPVAIRAFHRERDGELANPIADHAGLQSEICLCS